MKFKKQGIKPEAPYNLYDFLELDRKSGDNILKKLTQKGLVVRLSHNLFIEKQALEKLMQECLNLLKNQSLDVQSMKEYFNLSRKYAIAYLEYLDKFPPSKAKKLKKIFNKHLENHYRIKHNLFKGFVNYEKIKFNSCLFNIFVCCK